MTGSEAAASAECQNGDAHAITPPKHVRKYVKPKVLPLPLPSLRSPPRLTPQPHTTRHSPSGPQSAWGREQSRDSKYPPSSA